MKLSWRRGADVVQVAPEEINPLLGRSDLVSWLQDPNTLLKTLFKTPIRIIVTDAQCNIVWGNAAAINSQMPPEQLTVIMARFKDVVGSAKSFPISFDNEDANGVVLESSVDVIRDAEKTVLGFVCTYTDRTAQRVALNKAGALAERLGDTISVSESIQSVAVSTDQMVSSISEIAQGSARAAETARTAVEEAQRTGRTVAKLESSSSKIGSVVRVIRSIAEQTNLLALNATIEAARAGEAGKGFAIVAGEVKELARATSAATEEIGAMVEEIQTDAAEAISAISGISAVVEEIDEIQQTIASAVEEQSATTAEIGARVSSAARTAEDIAVFVAAQA